MSNLEKQKINEKKAAREFVGITLANIHDNWGRFCSLFKEIIKDGLADNKFAEFEFSMAFIALQMGTLFNLFPQFQATRIRDYIFDYLKEAMNNDNFAVELVEKYEKVIFSYPKFLYTAKYAVPPLENVSEAIGLVLVDSFSVDATIEYDGQKIYNVFSLNVIGDLLLSFSVDCNWNKYLNNIELTQ